MSRKLKILMDGKSLVGVGFDDEDLQEIDQAINLISAVRKQLVHFESRINKPSKYSQELIQRIIHL